MKSWQKSLIPLLALLLLAVALVLLFSKPGGAQFQSPLPPECSVTHWKSGYDFYQCRTPGRERPTYVPQDARCSLNCMNDDCTVYCQWVRKTPDPFTSPIQQQSVWTLYLPLVSR